MPKNIVQEAWTSRETFASVLLAMFIDRFGIEGVEWDPATITLEIEEEFNVDLPQLSLDKLFVAIQLITTDKFLTSLPDFITFCNVLSGDEYNPELWDPADAEEVAWGLTEAVMLSPLEDGDAFSEEIRAYIGSVLDSEGILNPPDVLKIALREARVSPNIEEFSDDPTMFNAVYDLEAGKTADINKTIEMRLSLLAAQLRALDLKNGKTEELVKILESSITQRSK